MAEFLWKLLASAVLTVFVKGAYTLFGVAMPWWFAAVMALALVFGGWLVFVWGDDF